MESKNYTFYNWGRCWGKSDPSRHLYPCNTEDVRSIVLNAVATRMASFPVDTTKTSLRAIGRGYSPNDICFTDGIMVHLEKMNKILNIDVEKKLVTCEAGCTVTEVAAALEKHNLVLPTSISVSDITLTGVAAVAAHGTGINVGTFSNYIVEVEGVSGTGELIKASELTGENKQLLPALRCHLGLLMIVTKITMRVFEKKLYKISSGPTVLEGDVLENLISKKIKENVHYKCIWVPGTNHVFETYTKEVSDKELSLIQQQDQKTFNLLPPVVCSGRGTPSFTRSARELAFYWAHDNYDRLKIVHNLFIKLWLNKESKGKDVGNIMHVNHLDVSFQHATIEWAVPVGRAVEAIKEWKEILEKEKLITHLLLEVRFTKADDPERVWISPTTARNETEMRDGFCFLGIVIFRPFDVDSDTIRSVFYRFQKVMMKYEGRPHWSKPYKLGHNELQQMYPKTWLAFESYKIKMDPHKLFENDWSRRHADPSLKSLL